MTNDRIKLLMEQATRDGNFDKDRFAELITGDCLAAVLDLEISSSNFISSVIEQKLGFEDGHFSDEWYQKNYLLPV